MQKLINVLALTSFGVSACVVGAGVYVYQNKDAIVDAAVQSAVAAAMPELPDVLSNAPLPSAGGGALPPVTLPF